MSTEHEVGRKDDACKRDWALMPWEGLETVVRVLEFGAQLYARDNWKLVPDSTRRYTTAMLRHVIAFSRGEMNDPGSGLPHIAHAVCCGLFLLCTRERP